MSNKLRLFEIISKIDNSYKPKLNELMSKLPVDVSNINSNNIDKEILRTAIISELDAINLYEQFANKTKNIKLKKILLDVAREEKAHVGEFETLLLSLDDQQRKELKNGNKEVDEKL